jgi:hypothetical protein
MNKFEVLIEIMALKEMDQFLAKKFLKAPQLLPSPLINSFFFS